MKILHEFSPEKQPAEFHAARRNCAGAGARFLLVSATLFRRAGEPSMTTSDSTQFSRRDFVKRLGMVGGSVTASLLALDLMAEDAGPPADFSQLPKITRPTKVVILGGGLAGMSSAYELRKLGYQCTILEARARVGGRCYTIRRGTKATDTRGETQECQFDEGHFLNPGPMRIPQHHRSTLHYCQEFGVELEVFNNNNYNAYYHDAQSGLKLRQREFRADMLGYTSELLSKVVQQDKLDRPLSADDKERLVEYLRDSADLSPDNFYKGSSTRGYDVWPGAYDNPGVVGAPADFSALLRSGFGKYTFAQDNYTQTPDMFHPVGGIDRIAAAFEKQVGKLVVYGAEIKRIGKTADGVRIEYTEKGETKAIAADYAICALPLTTLVKIPSDFTAAHRAAIASTTYGTGGKIGIQFKRRFWEQDEGIMGGITWTTLDIHNIVYPSYKYQSKTGVLIGYFVSQNDALDKMSHPEREAFALAQGEKIHPQYRAEFVNSFSHQWVNTPYNLGTCARWTPENRRTHYATLCKPDDRVFFAGEHMSYIGCWMAGAFESARMAVTGLHKRVLAS
jgi:monoamine oxidase